MAEANRIAQKKGCGKCRLVIDVALRRAAPRALQIGLETATPVYVTKKGRIVDLTKERRRKAKAR